MERLGRLPDCAENGCSGPVAIIDGELSQFCREHLKCMSEDCNVRATFRYLDDDFPTHCSNHKDRDMIDHFERE